MEQGLEAALADLDPQNKAPRTRTGKITALNNDKKALGPDGAVLDVPLRRHPVVCMDSPGPNRWLQAGSYPRRKPVN